MVGRIVAITCMAKIVFAQLGDCIGTLQCLCMVGGVVEAPTVELQDVWPARARGLQAQGPPLQEAQAGGHGMPRGQSTAWDAQRVHPKQAPPTGGP